MGSSPISGTSRRLAGFFWIVIFFVMQHVTYTPVGVCSRRIDFDLADDGTVRNVVFTGGCHGNTQGVARLAEGMPAQTLVERLNDIDCKGRGTSCPAQFARAIADAIGD